MRTWAIAAGVVAGVSLILGIISRILLVPISFGFVTLEAITFLRFTNTCLLAAIFLTALRIAEAK
ncbi:hypothetical protein B9J77_04305 [candidate division NPL-UPA2 bacterium Unc8]|uniref:Uncharacterized protein n=1 Tax=candidate division NPL-UPA2 bacterium Unc8 TaxID=1980939 RepID=A0A399FXC3_UNCN2|nr:hypothetical protein [Candidatus Psychracetigena formicireducens]MBT9138058.1 hypothetical protein [Bacillota bacterium]RIH99871.1 MAG: hypothetical protein B9J77_04305 [candidate division NPL-UPA2 bacterium Unc8]